MPIKKSKSPWFTSLEWEKHWFCAILLTYHDDLQLFERGDTIVTGGQSVIFPGQHWYDLQSRDRQSNALLHYYRKTI
jgi:hypothetical protein